MAGDQSAEEVKQEHLQAFGPTLGPLYHELYNEVILLHLKWLEYRKLYAKSEKRIELLNETAAFFFGVVQEVLWGNVLLHITRLTDPPIQGKFKNLTLLCLPDAVADQALADDLRVLVAASLDQSQFARDWRNKRLAHIDLSLAVDAKATPLPGVSRQNVEDALASFRQIMNRLHWAFFQSEVAFDRVLALEDADVLVYHLALAARS
jgi:hypothetical protein